MIGTQMTDSHSSDSYREHRKHRFTQIVDYKTNRAAPEDSLIV